MPPKLPTPEPTQLLWAQQLKREHNFLLTRMETLENAIIRLEKAAQSDAQKSELDEVVMQVKNLTENACTNEEVRKIHEEVSEQFDAISVSLGSVIIKVGQLDADNDRSLEGRKLASENEAVMMKRVREVEEQLKLYRDDLHELYRGVEVDHSQAEEIKKRLEGLAADVKREGGKVTKAEETVTVLKEVSTEIKNGMEKLKGDITELRGEMAAAVAIRNQDPDTQDAAGAVFDAVGFSSTPEPTRAPILRTYKAAPKKPTTKAAVVPVQQPTVKLSTVEKSAAKKPAALRAPQTGVAQPVTRPQLKVDLETTRPIIRTGRGWVEIARTPSVQDTSVVTHNPDDVAEGHSSWHQRRVESGPISKRLRNRPKPPDGTAEGGLVGMVKRGRDRPRKKQHSPSEDRFYDAQEKPYRPTRTTRIARSIEAPEAVPTRPRPRVIKQADDTQAMAILRGGEQGKKRKADSTAQGDSPVPKARQGLTNIFSSPMSSLPPIKDLPVRDKSTEKSKMDDSLNDKQKERTLVARKRRTIQQVDDMDVLKRYAEQMKTDY